MSFLGVRQRNYFCVDLHDVGGTDVCDEFDVFALGPVELPEQFVDCFLVIIEGKDAVGVEFVSTFRTPSVCHVGLEGIGTFWQLPWGVQQAGRLFLLLNGLLVNCFGLLFCHFFLLLTLKS